MHHVYFKILSSRFYNHVGKIVSLNIVWCVTPLKTRLRSWQNPIYRDNGKHILTTGLSLVLFDLLNKPLLNQFCGLIEFLETSLFMQGKTKCFITSWSSIYISPWISKNHPCSPFSSTVEISGYFGSQGFSSHF